MPSSRSKFFSPSPVWSDDDILVSPLNSQALSCSTPTDLPFEDSWNASWTGGSNLSLLEQVGAGTYGQVHRAKDEVTQEVFAVKTFKPLPSHEAALQVYIQNELKLHSFISSFDHPNIVKLVEVTQPPISPELRFVMEYYETNLQDAIAIRMCPPVPHHNLRKRLKENVPKFRPPFSRAELRDFCKQMLSGLSFLHSLGILHRDLKPANVLLKDNKLAICDFGQSIQSPDFQSSPHPPKDRWEVRGVKDPVTTLSYRPPEQLTGSGVCSTAGDMWAVACILVEMLTGKLLFSPVVASPSSNSPKPFRVELHPLPVTPKSPEEQLLSQIVGFLGAQPSQFSPPLLPHVPSRSCSKSFLMAGLAGLCSLSRGGAMEEDELLLNFLCGLLEYNPQSRLTAKEALQHPWLNTVFRE